MPNNINNSNNNTVIIAVIVIVTLMIYYFKFYKKGHKMIKVRSDIDDQMYVVKDVLTKQQASNALARVRKNMFTLTDYLVKNSDRYPEMRNYISRLNSKIYDVDISESDGSSEYTSFSVNKGDEIVFCLRSKQMKKLDKMHDINLIMYVALHEIAHVACPEYGHTELFNKIFAFLATVATELSLYTVIPFNSKPEEYCGLTITDSVI